MCIYACERLDRPVNTCELRVTVGQERSLPALLIVAGLWATGGSAGDEDGDGDGVDDLLPPPGLYVRPTGSPPLRTRL